MEETVIARVITQTKVWLVFVTLGFGLWLLDSRNMVSWLRGGLEWGLWPIREQVEHIWRTSREPFFRMQEMWMATYQLEIAHTELAELKVKLANLEQASDRITALEDEYQVSVLPAQITWQAAGWYASDGNYMIDVAMSEGVQEGSVVVDLSGALLGRVSIVGKRVSQVRRPFQLGERIPVRVLGQATQGELYGDGVLVTLKEVLPNQPLAPGDRLVTTGIDEVFPAGIVVGEVVELKTNPSDVTQTATVELWSQETANIVWVEAQL